MNTIIVEVVVGILPKNIPKMFRQINFEELFGNLTLQGNEGIVIKVPKNFSEDFNEFSIIFPDGYYLFHDAKFFIDISYDKLEFQTKFIKGSEISPVIPLFQVNPYKYINGSLSNSNNKYLYIYIHNLYDFEKTIYIKKPKIYSDAEFNKVNALPQLSGNDTIYYHKIKIPEPQNSNYIGIQYEVEGNIPKLSYLKNNIQYTYLYDFYFFYYFLPYDKRDKNSNAYLNYYDIQNNPGYINFLEVNENLGKSYFYPNIILNKTVTQLKGKNEIRIKINSLSYILYPNLVKYYFIINMEDYSGGMLSIVSGEKKP